MWVRVAGDFLNLDNVVVINFSQEDDGEMTVHIETLSGMVKRYHGHEARVFHSVLENLTSESTSDTIHDFPRDRPANK